MKKLIVALLVLTVLSALVVENESWRIFRRIGRFVRRVVRHVNTHIIPHACKWTCRLSMFRPSLRMACRLCKLRHLGKRELTEIDMQEILKTVPEEHKAMVLRSMKDPQADIADVDEGYSDDVGERGLEDDVDLDLLQRALEDAEDEEEDDARSMDDQQLERALEAN